MVDYDLEDYLRGFTSPSDLVQETARPTRKQITHQTPMLSLSKGYSAKDIRLWVDRCRKRLGLQPDDTLRIWSEYKFDGVSLSLLYEGGVLTTASTRGTGNIGECILRHVDMFTNIPKTIGDKNRVEVRGEALLLRREFQATNDRMVGQGLRPYQNARNALAGLLSRDDSVTGIALTFVAYDLILQTPHPQMTCSEDMYRALTVYGFTTSSGIGAETFHTDNLDELVNYHSRQDRVRTDMPYDVDGLVYKLDRLDYRKVLGAQDRYPVWAIAHKFTAESQTTTLLAINIDVSRHGTITPVAVVAPVFIGGVWIENVTLHNFDVIGKKDLRIGDTVLIKRAGDVIPHLESVVRRDDNTAMAYHNPTQCPSCGTLLVGKGKAKLTCPNTRNCKAQLVKRLLYVTSDSVFDLDGVALAMATYVVDSGITTIQGFLELSDKDPEWVAEKLTIPPYKARSLIRLIREMKISGRMPLDRLLLALNIPGVGGQASRSLARWATRKTEEAMRARRSGSKEDICLDYLLKTRGDDYSQELLLHTSIGDFTLASLKTHLAEPETRDLLEYMMHEIKFVYPDVKEAKAVVVFTGKFTTGTQDDLETAARKAGYMATSQVTKVTAYLIAGADPGVVKTKTAEKFGTPVITEEEWLRIVNT